MYYDIQTLFRELTVFRNPRLSRFRDHSSSSDTDWKPKQSSNSNNEECDSDSLDTSDLLSDTGIVCCKQSSESDDEEGSPSTTIRDEDLLSEPEDDEDLKEKVAKLEEYIPEECFTDVKELEKRASAFRGLFSDDSEDQDLPSDGKGRDLKPLNSLEEQSESDLSDDIPPPRPDVEELSDSSSEFSLSPPPFNLGEYKPDVHGNAENEVLFVGEFQLELRAPDERGFPLEDAQEVLEEFKSR